MRVKKQDADAGIARRVKLLSYYDDMPKKSGMLLFVYGTAMLTEIIVIEYKSLKETDFAWVFERQRRQKKQKKNSFATTKANLGK